MTTKHIRTTHAGSLPRTDELVAANRARRDAADGFRLDTTNEYSELLAGQVEALVRRQVDLGITTPGDGEYGKAVSPSVTRRRCFLPRRVPSPTPDMMRSRRTLRT